MNKAETFIKALKRYYQTSPKLCLQLIVLNSVQSVFPFAYATLMRIVFDMVAENVLHQDRSWTSLVYILIGTMVVSLLNKYLSNKRAIIQTELEFKLDQQISKEVYCRLVELTGIGFYENSSAHETIQISIQGGSIGTKQLFATFIGLLQAVTNSLLFFIAIIRIDTVLGICIVVLTIPQIILHLRSSEERYRQRLEDTEIERSMTYYQYLLTSPAYSKEVKSSNLGQYFLSKFEFWHSKLLYSRKIIFQKVIKREQVISLINETITNAVIVYAIFLAFKQTITIGEITLFLSATTNIQSSLMNLFQQLGLMNEGIRIFKVYNDFHPIETKLKAVKDHIKVEIPDTITFENVSFRYGPDLPWILNDFSITFERGKSHCVVGLNGVGKSTIVKLLLRLYEPDEGRILWNGTNINEMNPFILRDKVAVLWQDYLRFDLTIRENIGFGDIEFYEGADTVNFEKKISETLNKVNMNKWVNELTLGTSTFLRNWFPLRNDAIEISTGQWQKIGLARTLFRDKPVVIFDEPSTSLDTETENILIHMMKNSLKDKILIVISHDQKIIDQADIVSLLEKGNKK